MKEWLLQPVKAEVTTLTIDRTSVKYIVTQMDASCQVLTKGKFTMTREETMNALFDGYYSETHLTEATAEAEGTLCEGKVEKQREFVRAVLAESRQAFEAGFFAAVSILTGGVK